MSSRTKPREPAPRRSEPAATESLAEAEASTNPDGAESVRPPQPTPRKLMAAMVAVAAVWGVILVSMVLFTANPVTLNRRQFARADVAVTATVTDADKGTVTIDRVWFTTRPGILKPADSVTIERLTASGGSDGKTYIIPLSQNGPRSFNVATAFEGEKGPLIYPATDSAVTQVEGIVDDR